MSGTQTPPTLAQIAAARAEIASVGGGLGNLTNLQSHSNANRTDALGSLLNWDDTSAAQLYRQYQIQQIITGGVPI